MNAKKCDRCGKYFDSNNHYLILKAKPIIDLTEPMFGNEYDLCESCQQDFNNFMNSYKKEG